MYGDEIEPPLYDDIWNMLLEEFPHILPRVRCHFGFEQNTWKLQATNRRRWPLQLPWVKGVRNGRSTLAGERGGGRGKNGMTVQLGGAGLSTLSWTCCSEVQRLSFECRRAVDIPSPLQDCEHLPRRQVSIGPTSCRCQRRRLEQIALVGPRCTFWAALGVAWQVGVQ